MELKQNNICVIQITIHEICPSALRHFPVQHWNIYTCMMKKKEVITIKLCDFLDLRQVRIDRCWENKWMKKKMQINHRLTPICLFNVIYELWAHIFHFLYLSYNMWNIYTTHKWNYNNNNNNNENSKNNKNNDINQNNNCRWITMMMVMTMIEVPTKRYCYIAAGSADQSGQVNVCYYHNINNNNIVLCVCVWTIDDSKQMHSINCRRRLTRLWLFSRLLYIYIISYRQIQIKIN